MCVSPASPLHLVILLSHMECEGRRGAGVIIQTATPVSGVRLCVFAHAKCMLSWFMHTLLQPVSVPCLLLTSRQSSNRPTGIRSTASDICVSRVCVCICISARVCACEVRWKVELKGSLPQLLAITIFVIFY